MKIAAFNIQKFGIKKMLNPVVVEILIKIVSRYDIIVILEVVDRTDESVQQFIKKLNSTKENTQQPYSMELSKCLGRTKSKEQFMFLYREAAVKVAGTYQYPDTKHGDEDTFEREPFIVYFTCLTAAAKKLVLVPVHTKPTDFLNELKKLHVVVETVKRKWKTGNVMLLGDFNTGGTHWAKDKKSICIHEDEMFHWLIKDEVDTTTNQRTAHTYDRIVVSGKRLFDAVVLDSAKAFNFQQEFGLSEEIALQVSDHYPVEVELKEKQASGYSSAKCRK